MTKVIFLDRDGTINVDHHFVHKVEDFKFTPQAPEALKKLQQAGYKLAVVTNQSGIGRGYYTLADMHRLHEHMQSELKKQGVHIDALAYCPHDPDLQCNCRKPQPGMVRQIEEQLGEIDYAASWMIGDKEKDAGFGKNVGMKTALVRSSSWSEEQLAEQPDMIVDSLAEFATMIG